MNNINTRADLDALTGTPAHDTFMAALAGSVWRLEKDDAAKLWRAVQDASTIERYGFALSDFADVPAPALPAYVPPPTPSPQAQIDALEKSQMMPRATREFMLLSMEAQFPPEQLALNPGYAKVKAFDDQIKALRVQL